MDINQMIYIGIGIIGIIIIALIIQFITILMINHRLGKLLNLFKNIPKKQEEPEKPKITLEEIKQYEELKKKMEAA